jgi:hypothetical protein
LKSKVPALGAVVLMAVFPSLAISEELGRAEYLVSCASCHGAEGKGDGPLAELLKVEVTDLTALSERNGGQFPMLDVLGFIDGRACGPAIGNRPCPRPTGASQAHDRDMPAWGNRYKEAAVFDAGPQQTDSPEVVVLGRILALAYYLESIQQ